MNVFPLAPNGIFRSIQGEGELMGTPMVFVRLAGCSIGCAKCDTDYSVAQRWNGERIFEEVDRLAFPMKYPPKKPPQRAWVWITGGEPTDHEDIWALTEKLKSRFNVAVATAGHKKVPDTWERSAATFLSVSPHDPAKWVQFHGAELKIVPGLNGFRLADFNLEQPLFFGRKFVMPCAGMSETVGECLRFVQDHPDWKMTCQAHKQWGLS